MEAILKLILCLVIVAVPFIAVLWLMVRSSRNTGSHHGGGIRRWRQIRNGR